MHGRGGTPFIAPAVLIGLAASCASPEAQTPVLEPSTDAASEAQDVSVEAPMDAGGEAEADAVSSDAADVSVEAEGGEEAGACVPEEPYDASDGPCTKGTIEKQWCGACGHKQRFCGNDGQWKPWSDCMEDELSVCSQCETRAVSCGYCGKRAVSCETSQGACRWVLGGCAQAGECVAGDYELDAAGCAPGQVRIRRCSATCAWESAGACETGPGWEPLAQAPIAAREAAVSVVAGARWFLWGGLGEAGYLDDGAVFDPASGTWSKLAPATWPQAGAEAGVASLSARTGVAAAWTGEEVVLFGGMGEGDTIAGDGARWNPGTGWAGLSQTGAPSPRRDASAVRVGASRVVLIWGGRSKYGGAASGGGRYDPSTDAWLPVANAPMGARQGHTAVWDGLHGRMIVWGGSMDSSGPSERGGASYDPVTDSWSPISDAPIRRRNAFAFWDEASGKMLVVMGEDGAWMGPKGDGAAYDPSTDSWTLLPDLAMTGYLAGWKHAAVWGIGRAWVTGGDVAWAGGITSLGARYDSALDAWGKVPALDVSRAGHSAAWLDGLVVWGGRGAGGLLSSGARLRDSGIWP